jgi:hypothetical protein
MNIAAFRIGLTIMLKSYFSLLAAEADYKVAEGWRREWNWVPTFSS